jgi:hypothetical protein
VIACRFRARCAAQQLACAAFNQFMHNAPWQRAPRAPTHTRYAALFEGKRLPIYGRGGGRPRKVRPEAPERVAATV